MEFAVVNFERYPQSMFGRDSEAIAKKRQTCRKRPALESGRYNCEIPAGPRELIAILAEDEYPVRRSHPGVPMPRYLTQHTLACLTRQGAENLAQRMQNGGPARAERVLVNMLEGKMFVEFRADSREVLESWLKTEGMHFDWLVRIEWETRAQDGKLHVAD